MPIKTREDLKEYINADLSVQPRKKGILKLFSNENRIINLKLHLRKREYYYNSSHSFIKQILYSYHKFFLYRISSSFCSEIPINVFGKGLIIWHAERIIIYGNSKVGNYCSISSGVVIAQGHNECPIIDNNVELMIDSKVLGGIHVSENVHIGAGALVIKDIDTPNTTWAGVPAYQISNKGTIETPIPIAR